MLPNRRLASRSPLRVADEDDVGFRVAAYDGELLAAYPRRWIRSTPQGHLKFFHACQMQSSVS